MQILTLCITESGVLSTGAFIVGANPKCHCDWSRWPRDSCLTPIAGHYPLGSRVVLVHPDVTLATSTDLSVIEIN